MKTSEKDELEAITATDNPHWNEYALKFLGLARACGRFPDATVAVVLYAEVLGLVQEHHAEPLKADAEVEALLAGAAMDVEQRLIICRAAYAYLHESEFDVDLTSALILLKERTKAPKVPGWARTTRSGLQDLLKRELEALPGILANLEPRDRISALCKLLPYALPRLTNVEPVDSSHSNL